MKTIQLIGAIIVLTICGTSCKKDYTCTCTTTVGGISTTKVYDLQNQRYHDANDACERYETNANNGGFGTTACHL